RLYSDFPPSRRAALHWRAGERLASRGDIPNAAYHLLEGATTGDALRVAEIAKLAAAAAMARFAFEEVASLTRRALELLASSENVLSCELGIWRAKRESARASVARKTTAYGLRPSPAVSDHRLSRLVRHSRTAPSS